MVGHAAELDYIVSSVTTIPLTSPYGHFLPVA
jgi:hypothetical protein